MQIIFIRVELTALPQSRVGLAVAQNQLFACVCRTELELLSELAPRDFPMRLLG